MTARQPKRRPTPRERLLGECDWLASLSIYTVEHKRAFRRLLRLYERDLAERAMHEFDARFSDGRPFTNGAKLRAAVRAAILGPQRRGKR